MSTREPEADPCDGCHHKSGKPFGKCIHCKRIATDYYEKREVES